MIRIVTDSTCDLPSSLVNDLQITVLPLYINIGDKGYLDGIDLSREAFYQQLPSLKSHPTTAAPGPDVFRQTYDRLAAAGATEILSIHISETLSATINIARADRVATYAVPCRTIQQMLDELGDQEPKESKE